MVVHTLLVLALALVAWSASADLRFHGDGRVTAVNGAMVWDVTGWIPMRPDVKLSDPKLRHCFICHDGPPSEECVDSLDGLYSEICAAGLSEADQKAVAEAGFLSTLDAKAWCEARCNFKNITEQHNSEGMPHEQVACLHVPQVACHDALVFDARRKQSVEDGSIPRAEVASPPGYSGHVPPMSDEESAALAPAEGEDADSTQLRVAQAQLEHAMRHRQDAELPPVPKMCRTCAASGLGSHSCYHGARDLASHLCVDGSEGLLCAGGGPGCFPFPSEVADLRQREQEAMRASMPEEERDSLPAIHVLDSDAEAAAAEGAGPKSLDLRCAHAVVETCIRGVVMPTIGLRKPTPRRDEL